MNVEDLAKACGATFYRHRTSPYQAAVAFSPTAWEKFCQELEKPQAVETILLDPGCAERGCMAHDARDGTVEARIKGGKTGWPPGLLQDDNRQLSKWFASRLDARYALRSVLIQPFDNHETLTFHLLEAKS